MGAKNKQLHIKKDTDKIKWVRKAKCWCRTVISEGKQTITWASKKEDL